MIKDINLDIEEGKLLLRAIGLLMSYCPKNTPEEILDMLNK